MKRKRLALLLAIAMTVTSFDSTAMAVSGADFSSEIVETEEAEVQSEEAGTSTNEEEVSVDFADSEETGAEGLDEENTEDESEASDAEVQSITDGINGSEVQEYAEDEGEVTVSSVNANTENIQKTQFWADLEDGYFDGLSVTVNYSDTGHEPEELTFGDDDRSCLQCRT